MLAWLAAFFKNISVRSSKLHMHQHNSSGRYDMKSSVHEISMQAGVYFQLSRVSSLIILNNSSLAMNVLDRNVPDSKPYFMTDRHKTKVK
jgi:hypothetical protein